MNFGDSDPEHPFEHYELHFGQFPPQSHSAGDGTEEDANDHNGIQGKGSEEEEEEEELEGGEKANNRTRPIIRHFAKHELYVCPLNSFYIYFLIYCSGNH
jgi:hypothetical protein